MTATPPGASRPVLGTYRLQLGAGCTFADAAALVPYLARLGVTHLHASPVLEPAPGSTHGYDVADPGRVSRVLGGERAFRALVATLHEHGMGLVLDIVPNHMAAHPANAAWRDVLTWGRASPYARWFDVEWRAPEQALHARIVLPLLGDHRSALLARGEITLAWTGDRFVARYYEHELPLTPPSLPPLVRDAARRVADRLGAGHDAAVTLREVAALLGVLARARPRKAGSLDRWRERGLATMDRLVAAAEWWPAVADALVETAAAAGQGRDAARLARLLDAQVHHLVHWRPGTRRLNYRRFFDVAGLVSLHQEDPEVFRATHRLPLRWVHEGAVDGLRIDHPDGLLDPRGYLERLASTAFPDRAAPPVWVEKILMPGERLRDGWPVAGTTGYDFLNAVTALLVDPEGHAALVRHHERLARTRGRFEQVVRVAKRLVVEASLEAGVRQLARRLARLGGEHGVPTVRAAALVAPLVDLIAVFPVYRTYADERHPFGDAEDAAVLAHALAEAEARGRGTSDAWRLLRAAFLGPEHPFDAPREQLRLRALQRLQQLTGPAMAKGAEDTALYRRAPLVALAEVGGDPDRPLSHAVEEFHEAAVERAARWPRTMLALTTHDTKRSADLRARVAVLSELPDEWEEHCYRWRRLNRPWSATVRGHRAPDGVTELLLYQTLVGCWPVECERSGEVGLPDHAALASLCERVQAYVLKAVREMKLATSWLDPDVAYEDGVRRFVDALLDPARDDDFLPSLDRLARRIAPAGRVNALAQLVLQCTTPGVPDTYMGDERWQALLVDPDNRRPVDFAVRAAALARLADGVPDGAAPDDLRLAVLHRLLCLRQAEPALFLEGGYEPIAVSGERSAHVVAFRRTAGARTLVVAVPRLVHGLLDEGGALDPDAWGDTRLCVGAMPRMRSVLEGATVEALRGAVPVGPRLVTVPAMVLVSA